MMRLGPPFLEFGVVKKVGDREDWLRGMRERGMREGRFRKPAVRAVITKPITKPPVITKPVTEPVNRGGRPCIGDRAMTSYERLKRHRAKRRG